jgi:hypothetical protein
LNRGIRHGYISKYIHHLSHRPYPSVNHLAVQAGELSGIAPDD